MRLSSECYVTGLNVLPQVQIGKVVLLSSSSALLEHKMGGAKTPNACQHDECEAEELTVLQTGMCHYMSKQGNSGLSSSYGFLAQVAGAGKIECEAEV